MKTSPKDKPLVPLCFGKNRRQIAQVLTSWRMVCEEYCTAFQWTDCPWKYTERPGIGTLSGAVWRLKGIALEEFQVRKRGKYGRCDLYFGLKSGDLYRHYDVEAKHCWVKMYEKAEAARKKIDESIRDSVKAARRLPRVRSTRLGLTFVTFCGGDGESNGNKIQSWIEELSSQYKKSHAVAWFFDQRIEKTPGAAIILALVDC